MALGNLATCAQGRNKGKQGGQQFSGQRITMGVLKIPNYVTSTYFNTVRLLSKDHSFKYGAPNLLLALGAI